MNKFAIVVWLNYYEPYDRYDGPNGQHCPYCLDEEVWVDTKCKQERERLQTRTEELTPDQSLLILVLSALQDGW